MRKPYCLRSSGLSGKYRGCPNQALVSPCPVCQVSSANNVLTSSVILGRNGCCRKTLCHPWTILSQQLAMILEARLVAACNTHQQYLLLLTCFPNSVSFFLLNEWATYEMPWEAANQTAAPDKHQQHWGNQGCRHQMNTAG